MGLLLFVGGRAWRARRARRAQSRREIHRDRDLDLKSSVLQAVILVSRGVERSTRFGPEGGVLPMSHPLHVETSAHP